MAEAATKSQYQKLEKPVFESKIPVHLTKKMTAQETWVVETLSLLDSKSDWIVDRVLDHNQAHIDTDVRLRKIEDWKSMFSGKLAVVSGLALIVVSAIISAVIKTGWDRVMKP